MIIIMTGRGPTEGRELVIVMMVAVVVIVESFHISTVWIDIRRSISCGAIFSNKG